jgi:hypothetical protein
MGPEVGKDNDPSNIPLTVECIADIKCLDKQEVKEQIRNNFDAIFDNGEIIERYMKHSRRKEEEEASNNNKNTSAHTVAVS